MCEIFTDWECMLFQLQGEAKLAGRTLLPQKGSSCVMSKIDQWRKHEPTPEHFKRMGISSLQKSDQTRCPRCLLVEHEDVRAQASKDNNY